MAALAGVAALTGALALTPLGTYWKDRTEARRIAKRSLSRIRIDLSVLLSLLDRLQALMNSTGTQSAPLDITQGRMFLNPTQLAEARDIWKDLVKTVDRMFDTAIDLSTYFYREGMPIESKLEDAVRIVNGVRSANDYGTAATNLRHVASILYQYIDEASREMEQ